MSERDKKTNLGETAGTFVVAAILTWILFKARNGVWKWATANRSRARIVVPILLWPFTFVASYLAVLLILSWAGFLPSFGANPDNYTPEQHLADRMAFWFSWVVGLVIAIVIARGKARLIREPYSEARADEAETIEGIVARHGAEIRDAKIWLAPDIPAKKLQNAIRSYAQSISPADVLLLVDNTFWGSCRNGMLITRNRLYARDIWEEPQKIDISEIKTVRVSDGAFLKKLLINDKKFAAVDGIDVRREANHKKLCELVSELAHKWTEIQQSKRRRRSSVKDTKQPTDLEQLSPLVPVSASPSQITVVAEPPHELEKPSLQPVADEIHATATDTTPISPEEPLNGFGVLKRFVKAFLVWTCRIVGLVGCVAGIGCLLDAIRGTAKPDDPGVWGSIYIIFFFGCIAAFGFGHVRNKKPQANDRHS